MVRIVRVMARTPDSDEESREEVASITVRFPVSIRDGLKRRARDEERAFNTVVVRACRRYIENGGDETQGGGGASDRKKGR